MSAARPTTAEAGPDSTIRRFATPLKGRIALIAHDRDPGNLLLAVTRRDIGGPGPPSRRQDRRQAAAAGGFLTSNFRRDFVLSQFKRPHSRLGRLYLKLAAVESSRIQTGVSQLEFAPNGCRFRPTPNCFLMRAVTHVVQSNRGRGSSVTEYDRRSSDATFHT